MDNTYEKDSKKKHSVIKIILIIFILLIIVAIASGYFYIKNEQNKIKETNLNAIKDVSESMEYGSSVNYETILEKFVASGELSENSTVQIEVNNKTLNPSEEYIFQFVGNTTIKITVTCNKLSFLKQTVTAKKEITLEVVDTKVPVISGVEDIEITEGDNLDLSTSIIAKDEVDGDLEVKIEGDFDSNTVGTYTLTAKAVDKNQNETTKEFTVTVKEKQVTTPSKPTTNTSTSNNKNSSSSASSSSSSSNSSAGNLSSSGSTGNSSSSTGSSSSSSNSSTGSSNSNSSAGSSSSSGSTGNSSSSTSSSNSSSNSSTGSSSSTSSESTAAGRLALAKAEAKRVVSKVISPGMTNYQKANAICMYITNTVASQTNQSLEAYKTNYGNEAYAALVMKIAACSGRCKAVTLLCDAAGLKSQHINANTWSHQWNKIQMEDGSWIVIDSQIGYIGTTHPLE